MMRVFFFLMGVPMMIMSFFEAIDVMPYVDTASVIHDGHMIELTQDEQETLIEGACAMLERAHTLPAFAVVFDDLYKQEIQSGYFVSLKFPSIMEINNLPFDELIFRVEPDFSGFNFMRGMKGIVQGRCIYIDLQDQTMTNFYDTITNFESVKNFELPIEENKDNINEDGGADLNLQEENGEGMQDNENAEINEENDLETNENFLESTEINNDNGLQEEITEQPNDEIVEEKSKIE